MAENLDSPAGPDQADAGASRSSNNIRPDAAANTNTNRQPPPQTTSRGIPTPVARSMGSFSGTQSLSTSRSPSNNASPRSSRDSSPAGRAFRQQSVPGATSQGMRTRKDSHDVSPHRPPSITGYNSSSIPSAAAIQRALSAASVPQLQPAPTTDPVSRIARPTPRTNTATPVDGAPSFPLSPRVKSPPPSRSRKNSLRTIQNSDTVTPNIIIQSATPNTSTDTLPTLESLPVREPEPKHSAPSKTTSRGASGAPTLETVQETSNPATPGGELDAVASTSNTDRKYFDNSEDDRKVPSGQTTPRRSMATARSQGKASNSDSDSGGKKDGDIKGEDVDPDKTPRPTTISNRPSFSSLRTKTAAEPIARNMTVETETVNSVAQNTLGAPSDRVSSGRPENHGTLRTKVSTDTIRPGKGRKKASRKVPSINATAASTRADFFEDRVKNEMEEATSDDSEETFVYESNPPEQPIRRSRHHSRTPSGASLASMERNTRPAQIALNAQKTRSMKFANQYNSADDEAIERQDGTIRANATRNGGSSIHHHHTGRPTRTATGHASILDEESPFPPLNKVRSLTGMPGRPTQNSRTIARSLNTSNGSNGSSGIRKDNGYMSYDLDAEGGDDERTPLISGMGTVRTPRNLRRPPTRGSRTERFPRRRQSLLTRFAGCIAVISMLFLLIFGIVGFLFIVTTPLLEVNIQDIQNVLASEQELMFDVLVGAVNPNLLPISVSDLDVMVFARSKFVGSEKWWREHPHGDWHEEPMPRELDGLTRNTADAEDNAQISSDVRTKQNYLPTIPAPIPDDSDGDVAKTTMLLGTVYHFDSPLTFDPSFLKRHVHVSKGGISISQPGNRSELGGTERWERVLLHDFELTVRGTLKYSIPLGGRTYAASVNAKVIVQPGKDDTTPDQPTTPGDGEAPVDGEVRASRLPKNEKWEYEVLPPNDEDEDSIQERLRRRVWARMLRQI